MPLSISVVVPSYRRPDDLRRCLLALRDQESPAAQVIVVHRDTDEVTRAELDSLSALGLPLTVVSVTAPGVVAALNTGLAVAEGDVIAFTDDDATPRPDWIAHLRAAYERFPQAAGVGGRDMIPHEAGAPETTDVGTIQWFGRAIGNHHRGSGIARPVDVLKGVNMSFRRTAVRRFGLDERLWGSGAQVHNEMGLCLQIRRTGGELIYDPTILVDHYPATRFDPDQRNTFSQRAFEDSAYNETLILLEYLPGLRKVAFLLWSTLIGMRASPGFLQCARLALQGNTKIWSALMPILRGRLAAVRAYASGSRGRSVIG